MRNAPRSHYVDPDPFTVAVGIAGIIGGVASVIATYRSGAPNQSLKQRRKLRSILGEADDLLRYLETDVQLLRDLLKRANIPEQRRFRLGSRAFLNVDDFDRYAQVTDAMYTRLRKLLSSTHGIERVFTRIDPFPGFEPVSQIDDIRGLVGSLLRDGDQTVEQALDSLANLVHMTRNMVHELERALALES